MPGVSASASAKMSSTGMALLVPVAFLSGASMLVSTPAASGADTAQKKQGVALSRLTNCCVAGVAMQKTRS